jgi:hypothetical protein
VNKANQWLVDNNVSMCDVAFAVDGVLHDQTSYYLDRNAVIRNNIEDVAADVVDSLTL